MPAVIHNELVRSALWMLIAAMNSSGLKDSHPDLYYEIKDAAVRWSKLFR
jgi:hypothetical protein